MNIEIVQGRFCDSKEYCENKTGEGICFELSHIESDEKARFEFNRFIQEVYAGDVIGVSSFPVSVILNLSAWNESYCYNRYLESFLYMLSDMHSEVNCSIIFEKEINKDLYKKMKNLDLFTFSLTALPDVEKKKETVKLGFYDNSVVKGEDRNV